MTYRISYINYGKLMTENKWFTRSFRRNLVDMHIADRDDTFLSQFDPEEYLECL